MLRLGESLWSLRLGPSVLGVLGPPGPPSGPSSRSLRPASHLVKKRSSMDPEMAKTREEKKRRNLERDIIHMLKRPRNLKPLEEAEVEPRVRRRKEFYERAPAEVAFEESERRALLLKRWAAHQASVARKENHNIKAMQRGQARALRELRELAPSLYDAAVQPDLGLLSLTLQGPTATPALAHYASPDGDYVETTRTFQHTLEVDVRELREKWGSRNWAEIKAERKRMRKGKSAVRQEVGDDVQQGLLSLPQPL